MGLLDALATWAVVVLCLSPGTPSGGGHSDNLMGRERVPQF